MKRPRKPPRPQANSQVAAQVSAVWRLPTRGARLYHGCVHGGRNRFLTVLVVSVLTSALQAPPAFAEDTDEANLARQFAELRSPFVARRAAASRIVQRHAHAARLWARNTFRQQHAARDVVAALAVLGDVGEEGDLKFVYTSLRALAATNDSKSSPNALSNHADELAEACLRLVERLPPKHGPWLPINSLPAALTPPIATAMRSRLGAGGIPAAIRHGGEGLRPAMIALLNDSRLGPEQRLRVVAILGRMGGATAREALASLDVDTFDRNRHTLWYSLREVGRGDALDPVHTWINKLVGRSCLESTRSPPWSAWHRGERIAFLSFLRSIQDDAWRESVIAYLEDQIQRRGSGNVSYFEHIARLYVALGDPSDYHLARIVGHAAGPVMGRRPSRQIGRAAFLQIVSRYRDRPAVRAALKTLRDLRRAIPDAVRAWAHFLAGEAEPQAVEAMARKLIRGKGETPSLASQIHGTRLLDALKRPLSPDIVRELAVHGHSSMRRWAMARAHRALERHEVQALAAKLIEDSDDGVMLAALARLDPAGVPAATANRLKHLAVAGNRGSRRTAVGWLARRAGQAQREREDTLDSRIRAAAGFPSPADRPDWIGGHEPALQEHEPEAR